MKAYKWVLVLLFCSLFACNHADIPDIDGMWQLKSIRESDGSIQWVDTMYYSFQSQRLFAFTQLNGDVLQSNPTLVLYGYADFPDRDHLHIEMDVQGEYYFSLLPWQSASVDYFIHKCSAKEMLLEDKGVLYQFIKF
jgi:hypothetical protein